jgi:ABC-2 type transport system permease protein
VTPARALVGLHARLLRRSTFVLAGLFFAASLAVVAGYEGVYPEGSDRSAAVALGENPGFRAILGSGAGLDTAGGFTAWRFGGPAVIIVAAWSYLAATRLLRGEEDDGRAELMWAGAITGSTVVGSVMVVIAAGTVVLVAGAGLGMVAGGAPVGGSMLTAGSVGIGGFVFGAFGVVAAQVLPTRRAAALTSGGVVAGAFLVRAIANTKDGLEWLRWATPFGWSELVRPFGERTPVPFVIAAATTAVLGTLGARLARHRDLGGAIVPDRPSRSPRDAGLRSSLGFAGRQGLPRAAVWVVPLLVLTTTFGLLSRDIGEFFQSNETFIEVFERFDVDPSVPVRAFLGFVASTFAIVGVCFAVSEMGAAREEEATTRLDNLLTRAVTRRSWFAGRLVVTVAASSSSPPDSRSGPPRAPRWAVLTSQSSSSRPSPSTPCRSHSLSSGSPRWCSPPPRGPRPPSGSGSWPPRSCGRSSARPSGRRNGRSTSRPSLTSHRCPHRA